MRLLCVVPGNSGFCAIRQLLQRSLLGLSQASQASPTQSRPSQRRSARRPVVEKEVNWTPAMVDKELAKIVEDRGKKGVNKMEQVGRLEMLCTKVRQHRDNTSDNIDGACVCMCACAFVCVCV